MSDSPLNLRRLVDQWWSDNLQHRGWIWTAREFMSKWIEFVRESMPDRKRQKYGDVDYDWENRVDTTSANVGWKDRLAGLFLSPYQPTEPTLFHEMLHSLRIDYSTSTFIDLGSGKGRTLLMAAEYPFNRVIGVEVLPTLHEIASANIAKYKSDAQKCLALEALCLDARDYAFPGEPIVLYLFNPLSQSGLERVMSNLKSSLRERPRTVYVLYHNPLLEDVLTRGGVLRKTAGTHQFSVFTNSP